MADYYELLGISREADAAEIKRAYRNLARQLHPDANPGDSTAEERFKEITKAYDVLSDPDKRRRYDTFGDDRAAGFGDFGDIGGISDLFATFFGGMGATTRSRRGPARGADVVAEVDISLEEAAAGVERSVEVKTLAECDTCGGTGAAPGTFPSRCRECGGTGELREVRRTMLGNMMTATACGQCGGTGEEIVERCRSCKGSGRTEATESLTLQIPPGIDDGAQLRVSGRGHAGTRGARSGDLYVVVNIDPHPVFRRAGDDLACEVGVPMTVAALGGEVEVPTLGDPESLEIGVGTQSGEVVRLRGRGMPRLRGRGRGELVVLLKVETPRELDDEQADLLRAFARLRGEEPGPKGVFEKIKEVFK